MKLTFYGVVARVISAFTPIKKNQWVFGSDYGNMYREGARFLYEFVRKEHPEYHCIFITRNPAVKKELDEKGYPCEMNLSLAGMKSIAQADVVFTTQSGTDIFFAYKKKNRRFYYIGHSQPYKAAYLATPQAYANKNYLLSQPKGIKGFVNKVCRFFVNGYDYKDSVFYVSTSEFLVSFNKMFFGENADIRITGMPRNDILFNDEAMKNERWIEGLEGKLVITYMPTHRDYGLGKVTPIPFINDKIVQQWLKDNNVVLLVKQHPNMEKRVEQDFYTESIIDITRKKYDPQVCLYHSDAVVTDYSSAFIDFLLLKRPVFFYFYDDYEKSDTGILFDVKDDFPDKICYSESDFFECIKRIKENYDAMKPSDQIISKYHKYVDGNSCERYFNAVIEDKI